MNQTVTSKFISVYDISWMTNSLILATESFFCDHTGLVHFDPAYQETKFRLLEASASSVMAVSYNYLTGTLAYADIDGNFIVHTMAVIELKVGCVFPMVVVSLLPPSQFRLNDHREDAPHFI